MSLDSLASNGIINFDPEAYVKTGASKFEGEQENYLPFDKPLLATPQMYGMPYAPQLHGEPENDAFVSRLKEKHSKLPWKGIAVTSVIGGLALAAGIKIKSLFNNRHIFSNPIKTKSNKQSGGFFSNITSRFKKDGKEEVKKRSKKAAETSKKEAENVAKESKGFFKRLKNLPKSAKIIGGITAGIVGLYAVYKAFFAHKIQGHAHQHNAEEQNPHSTIHH